MKLDAKAIRYLTSEDFKVLAAVLIGPSSFLVPRDVYINRRRAYVLC
jgi:hypothetical protein